MTTRVKSNSTLWEMEPGQGYLIRATQPVTLVYPVGTGQGATSRTESTEACDAATPTPYFSLLYGALTLGGVPAPAGTRVEIVTPRGEVAGCFDVRYAGEYGYVHVYGADDGEPPIPGFLAGEPLAFRVGGVLVEPSHPITWTHDLTPRAVDLGADAHRVYLPVVRREQ